MYYIKHIKDSIGNNYLGISFGYEDIEPFIDKLSDIINDDRFELLKYNKFRRDGNNWHITVINVMEYNKAIKILGSDLFTKKLGYILQMCIDDIKLIGVGKAEKLSNESYFIVVGSDKLQEVRKSLGYMNKDLHITIGFDKRDVFGVDKNRSSII